MAWTSLGAAYGVLSSGDTKTSATSSTTQASGGVARSAGSYVIVFIAKDNTSTTDGDNSEVTSVSDSAGNSFTKLAEFTNAQTGAATGATISLWGCKIGTALTTTTTVTANYASACTAKGILGWAFSITSGNSVSVQGSVQTLANDGADPGSMTVSGLTSGEYLFVRGTALERAVGGTWTNTTNYTDIGGTGSAGGGGATNMSCQGEFRILTGTGDTSDPSGTPVDNASVFFALQEASSDRTLTPSLFTNSNSFPAATITLFLTPSLFTNSNSFPAATITLFLTPSLFTNSNSFPAATISFVIFPSLFTNSNTFFSPTVGSGTQTLTPSLFDNLGEYITNGTFTTDTSGWTPSANATLSVVSGKLHTVTTDGNDAYGYQSFVVPPTENSNPVYRLSLDVTTGSTSAILRLGSTAGGTDISSSVLTSNGTRTFDVIPGVSPVYISVGAWVGSVNAYAEVDNVSWKFWSLREPSIATSNTLLPSLFTNTNTFFSAAITKQLFPSLLTNTNSFFAATLSSVYGLTPSLFTNSNSFFSATVSSFLPLLPSLFTNSNTFFSPLLIYDQTLTATLYVNVNSFFPEELVRLERWDANPDFKAGKPISFRKRINVRTNFRG